MSWFLLQRMSESRNLGGTPLGRRPSGGLWTYDRAPLELINEQTGAKIDASWLSAAQSASVKLFSVNSTSNGSGALVSDRGLVLTCYHCIQSSLADASRDGMNLLESGWLARRPQEEVRCASRVADVLIGIEDVTERVRVSLEAARGAGLASILSDIEEAVRREEHSAGCEWFHCSLISLYQGAQYHLYRYHRYTDVRLVFAPESGVGWFGGMLDNFAFPRWAFECAFVRLYEDGAPAVTPNFVSVNDEPLQANKPVFVSGNPMLTERSKTIAQLEHKRGIELPFWLLLASELRGRLKEFMRARASPGLESAVFLLENWIMIKRQHLDALLNTAQWQTKCEAEGRLRGRYREQHSNDDPWRQIERATSKYKEFFAAHALSELGGEWSGQLSRFAKTIVRAHTENAKLSERRQPGFGPAASAQIEKSLAVALPIDLDAEILQFGFWLEKLLEWLGPEDPMLSSIDLSDGVYGLSGRLVGSTKLADPTERIKLWRRGGPYTTSDDPLLGFYSSLEHHTTALRDRYEGEVVAAIEPSSASIGRFLLEVGTQQTYPDATATLRLSHGRIEGTAVDESPFTTFESFFERGRDSAPYLIPPRWKAARGRLDSETSLNFLSSTDIGPGNSGSPVLDERANLVGVVFDGNHASMDGAFYFDCERNRTISVSAQAILEALRHVYGASELLSELAHAGADCVDQK